MVVGAFPAAKLGALLLRQISKPIANAVKEQAKNSPVFRKYVCMPPAQFYNWCEVKCKMWILNLGKPVNIPVLNEAMAIELGANLLGEGIIFIIAAGVLLSEYNRSLNKEAAKEEAKKQEMIDLQNTIKELFIQTEEQSAHLREMTRKLFDLETKLQTSNNQNTYKPQSTSGSQEKNNQFLLNSVSFNDKSEDYHRSLQLTHEPSTFSNTSHVQRDQYASIILRAVNDVENEFWNYSVAEEDNILFLSLNHLENLLGLRT